MYTNCCLCFDIQNNFGTQHVLQMLRASEKNIQEDQIELNLYWENFEFMKIILVCLDEIKNFLKVCYQTLRWNEVSEWRHILGTKSAFKRGMMNFDFRKLAQFWICLAKGRFFSESMMNFSYCQKKICRKLCWKRYFEIVFCLESADSNCTAVSKGGKIQSLG